jgi:hypothetical protein
MKRLFAIALLIVLCGCTHEERKDKTEPGKVVDLVYTPSTHGDGVGMDMTGKGGISIVSVDVQEKYAVVFECQHGKFIVQGDKDSPAHAEWQKLHKDEPVIISYQEIFDVDDKTKTAVIKGYHFLDANLSDQK